jgi:hypothetical protein
MSRRGAGGRQKQTWWRRKDGNRSFCLFVWFGGLGWPMLLAPMGPAGLNLPCWNLEQVAEKCFDLKTKR